MVNPGQVDTSTSYLLYLRLGEYVLVVAVIEGQKDGDRQNTR